MGEYQIILYILAAVVYFLWQANKKSYKGNEPTQQVSPDPEPEKPVEEPKKPKKPSITLESVLKEYERKIQDMPTKVDTTQEGGRKKTVDPKKSINLKEGVKKKLSNFYKSSEDALHEKSELDNGHFSPYALPKETINPIGDMLSKPESLRNAFILSEILKRPNHF
ncbi:MAG: hypothetical protein EAZ97_05175 [Bacteroidetes bacterium]|nr:MAG: hypothetical protein EAZ97_05175 [Bacteroidota bacterium]